MTPPATKLLPLLLAALLAGCASVPEVESRLRSLRFHPNMYVVQAGDTLETIAFRYELAVTDLAALNPGLDRSGMLPAGLRINVRPGTQLAEAVRIRSTAAPTSSAPASVPATRDSASSEPAAWREQESAYLSASQPDVLEAVPNAVPRRASDGLTASAAPAGSFPDREGEIAREADARLLARNETYLDDTIVRESFRREDVRREEPLRPGADAFARDGGAGGAVPREEVLPGDYDIGGVESEARGGASLDESLQPHLGRWTWPIDGAVARRFAPERIGGQGVDIAGVPGQEVRAAGDGTVVYSGRDLSGDGQLVILRHDDDLMTTYSHTDEIYVSEEQRVLAGDVIASLGWNEQRESVLGFEVRRDGNPLDPMAFLPPR